MGLIIDGTELARVTRLLKKTVHGDFRIQFDSCPFRVQYWFREYEHDIASFTLVQQINCCGILVSTGTWVHSDSQGKGIAQEMMELKEAIAIEFNFGMLLATVNMTGNPAEVHILEKFGWKLGNDFINQRTKNQVGVFTKNLKLEDLK